MKKVWNITGMPGGPPARTLVLFGQAVRPGRYVKVDDAQLKGAHKIRKDAELGLVHIGDKLPKDYPGVLNIPRVAPSPKAVNGHKPAGPAKVTKRVETNVAPKVEIKAATKPVRLSPKKKVDDDEKSGGK